MVKRKCGTCRYFEDREIAGSGWCQHPDRRDLQDIVLVRKSELACRNGWDQDLWEAADETSAPRPTPPEVHVPLASEIERNRIGNPSSDRITPVPAQPGELYTDKITSIGMRMTPAASHPDRVEPSALQAHDSRESSQQSLSPEESRSAVREARRRREEARKAEQRRHQESILRSAGDLLDRDVEDKESVAPPPQPPTRPDPPRSAVPPVPRPTVPITRPVQDSRDRVPPAPVPRIPPRVSPEASASEPQPSIEYPAKPPRFEQPPMGKRPQPLVGRPPVAPPELASASAPVARQGVSGGTEPLPTLEVQAATGRVSRTTTPSQRPPTSPNVGSSLRPTTPVSESMPAASVQAPMRERRSPGSPSTHEPVAPARSHGSATRTLVLEVDPIDVADHLRGVQRCCGTCRDFKRVGDSDRGWCANAYAFAERRMVHSQDLACRSSIGVWWLPHDDLWLEQADTTHHGRPTPLLDEFLKTRSVG